MQSVKMFIAWSASVSVPPRPLASIPIPSRPSTHEVFKTKVKTSVSRYVSNPRPMSSIPTFLVGVVQGEGSSEESEEEVSLGFKVKDLHGLGSLLIRANEGTFFHCE